MLDKNITPARSYAQGIGEAVANRTINRKIERKIGDQVVVETEKWEDVADRVAIGNALLKALNPNAFTAEYLRSVHHLRQASILMSGRHLQHGDSTQPTRNIEVFTNCATSAASFVTFYLLLNGAGVGRAYDDSMMVVNWSDMPTVVPVIDSHHKDSMSGEITFMDRRSAEHLYASMKAKTVVFEVPDSREGWAQAIEKIETMAFEGKKNHLLILDFSNVRPRNAPIAGMQGRPSSGPGPLMTAIARISAIKGTRMEPWRAAMYVDHYLAECVLVGGARRAARMSTKFWRDTSVLDFIEIKRGGFLWSSNNSVTVDESFWQESKTPGTWASKVLDHIARCSYFDGTGEPGIINQDKLVENKTGLEVYADGIVAESKRFKPSVESKKLFKEIVKKAQAAKYSMITNPCGEIALFALGGYCVIGDVVPFHAQNDDDAEDAFRTMVRMLIRTNTMDALYGREVARTNRIGVSMTGIHEYAWSRFGFGWADLVDEQKSMPFWEMLSRFKAAVNDEAEKYSKELGVSVPHTNTTIKPAGTTSKLFGLTEGAHLPSMREYIRNVQFRSDDPLLETYKAKGYPIRTLKSYSGTTIVGFPTKPTICTLGMGDKLVTAAEATPEEQYEWLRLLEKYWIIGVDGKGQLLSDNGNQVSYTLKYDPKRVDFDHFKQTLATNQGTIKACSVMPQTDLSEIAYEYLPEEPITKEEYDRICGELREEAVAEEIGLEHVDCSTGACPIDFREKAA